jgi:hypothetical protein
MVGIRRKSFAIPDRVFDILEDQPMELEVEVLRIIRAYSHYWDDFGTDEGFDFDEMSLEAQRVFFRVYDELKENNEKYFAKCCILTENANASVKAKKKKSVRRKISKEYYENHRNSINSKRREEYAKNKKGQTKAKNEAKKVSDESIQSQGGIDLAENLANADRIIGLNNIPSLHSEILLDRGCGGKDNQPMIQEVSEDCSNQTSGLSCSKAVQTTSSVAVCGSKARGTGAVKGSKGSKVSVAVDAASPEPLPVDGLEAVSCGAEAPQSSARMVCAADHVPSSKTSSLLSAPHSPREGEILVTKKFKIDFDDPVFKPYHRADKFLRKGVEDWIKANKLGCSIEKRWIAKQIYAFAQRQNKLTVLMGVEE